MVSGLLLGQYYGTITTTMVTRLSIGTIIT